MQRIINLDIHIINFGSSEIHVWPRTSIFI